MPTLQTHRSLFPPDPPGDVLRLVDRARECERQGHSAEARKLYEGALTLLRPPAAGVLASELARWIGRTYGADGDISAGLDCAELALAVAEAHGDAAASAHALNVMGSLHQSRGDLDEAAFLYRRAEAMAREAGDARLTGMLRMNLGTIANIRGEFDAALAEYENCLVGFRAAQADDFLGYVLNNTGMLYADLARWAEAEAAFREALVVSERSGNTGTRAMVLTNYADVLVESGRLCEAERVCDQAWELVPDISDERILAELQKVHGAVLRERGRLDDAETLLSRAAETAQSREDLLLLAEVLREQAVLFAQRGRNQETLRCLNRSHALFTRLRARKDIADLGRKLEQLESTFLSMVRRWGESIESADRYTQGHCMRVADYACALARAVGLDEEVLLWFRMGALLHDVGKIAVPSEVLNKPGGLTPEERMLIERHPDVGVKLLQDIEFPWDIRPMVRFHHERWAGGGYPTGIAGEAIPLPARILAIADVFDALSTDRPYRRAIPVEQCLAIMQESMAGHFDPELMRIWLELCRDGGIAHQAAPAGAAAEPPVPTPFPDHVLLVGNRHSAMELEEMSLRWGGSGVQYTIVLPLPGTAARAQPGEVAAIVVALAGGPAECIPTVVGLRDAFPDVPLIAVVDEADDDLMLGLIQHGAHECLLAAAADADAVRRSVRHAMERARHQHDLRHQSLRDDLTGLFNRRGFHSLAERRLEAAPRYGLRPVLVYVDLDNLKQVNDTFGHAEGDRVLMETASVLRAVFRESDVLARIGGDEFVVLTLLPAGTPTAGVVERITGELALRNAGDRRYPLAASIGTAAGDPGACTLADLMERADADMYAYKRWSRGGRAPLAGHPGAWLRG